MDAPSYVLCNHINAYNYRNSICIVGIAYIEVSVFGCYCMGPFIKDVINPGAGGVPKDDRTSIKSETRGRGFKNQKNLMTSFLNGPYLRVQIMKIIGGFPIS